MSKDDKKYMRLYRNIHRALFDDTTKLFFVNQVFKQLFEICVKYRTRIGRLKRQVQHLNKENKLLCNQYFKLLDLSIKLNDELKELKSGNETN